MSRGARARRRERRRRDATLVAVLVGATLLALGCGLLTAGALVVVAGGGEQVQVDQVRRQGRTHGGVVVAPGAEAGRFVTVDDDHDGTYWLTPVWPGGAYSRGVGRPGFWLLAVGTVVGGVGVAAAARALRRTPRAAAGGPDAAASR